MKHRISNDFKERLLKGDITGEFDVNLYAVNSHFKEVYDTEDMAFEHFRRLNEFNIFSHNNFRTIPQYNANCLSACLFDYYTMPVTYSAYYNNDVADKPLFVNAENWEKFVAVYGSIEGDENIARIRAYIEEGSRDFDDRNGGFYYVQEKSQMKWLANRVNNEYDFNNKLVIVLGDDLGGIGTTTSDKPETEFYTELDFCICPEAEHPFNGVFDLNGHTIQMFNVICSDYSNGFIGYLGRDGIVRNGRIGRLLFDNRKKISLETIKTENTDIFVGGLVGTNYGTVENIETFGRIEFKGFMPEVYLVQNKDEYYEGVDTIIDSKKNVFWPDRFCLNSPYNTIPYVGYFCEGVDSYFNNRLCEDGISYNNHYCQAFHEWKRMINNFYDTKNCELMKINNDNIFHHDKYEAYWGMLRNCQIPMVQAYDDSNEYTSKLISQYRSDHSAGGNNRRFTLISHAAEYAFIGGAGNVNVCGGHEWLRQYNYRCRYHKRMNRLGRNAYYCSPLVGTNFGEIHKINAQAYIVESTDTFVGFIGMIAGKYNKGNISNIVSTMSVQRNPLHKGTMRIYNNSQQFDGEGRNRAFGYHYNRNMNKNDKNNNSKSFQVPRYSLCYLDANGGPSGPNWSYSKTSGYNWFHQMGSKEYGYCNWFVREWDKTVTASGENWVACDPSAIGENFKNDAVVNAATSAAMKLRFTHVDTNKPDTAINSDGNSDFAVTVKYANTVYTRSDKSELKYTPHVRFYDTTYISDSQQPMGRENPKRVMSLQQLDTLGWAAAYDKVKNDDAGIPNVAFNSFEDTSEFSSDVKYEFDVIDFNMEYLTNNTQKKHYGNRPTLYCESTKTYKTSAFEERTADQEGEPEIYALFSDTSGKYYVLNSAYETSCSARALKIQEALMLQGVALGAQCPYHIAHDTDDNYMKNLGSDSSDGKQFYRIWGDPGVNGGHSKVYGFLGINTNEYCKHDWYTTSDSPGETTCHECSVKSSMITITVDNETLPDSFINKIKNCWNTSSRMSIQLSESSKVKAQELNEKAMANAKVQIDKIYIPTWNISMNGRRSAKIGDSDYYRNYISFRYGSNERGYDDDEDNNLWNYLNVCYSYIHFSLVIPEAVLNTTTGAYEFNYNHCKIIRGILELPTPYVDFPICITHVKERKKMKIEDVSYEKHDNVFLNQQAWYDAIVAGKEPPTPTKGAASIPLYSNGMETPVWHEDVQTQKVDVFIEMAPYSMDEIASSEKLEYEMPSIYNVGGLVGMYTPSFVGPDYTNGITEWGASKNNVISDCCITVDSNTKSFMDSVNCAYIKGRSKNAVITENPGKVNYGMISDNCIPVANKFAGVAPIVEINVGDMGVYPGDGVRKFTFDDPTSEMAYNPHPDYMCQYGRFTNKIRNIEVFLKPYSVVGEKYITTSRMNNQFFSKYFNWCNYTMVFDGSFGAYQLTTGSPADVDDAFIFGVSWDQPNALAPILGRYYCEPSLNKAVVPSGVTKKNANGTQMQLSFAEYITTGRCPNDYDDLKAEDGGTLSNAYGTQGVNPVKLFGDYQYGYGTFYQLIQTTAGKYLEKDRRYWSNRSLRQCFMRHYEIAGQLLDIENVRTYEPKYINTNGQITWNKNIQLDDIYMNPMMNCFSDSMDLYQPMYSENSNYCDMKIARPAMPLVTHGNRNADLNAWLTECSFNDYWNFQYTSNYTPINPVGTEEVKDNVFTYDYLLGEPERHVIGSPAAQGKIHYTTGRFLFTQNEGDVSMPITKKGKFNDGSVLHLGLIPTASALPQLISESEMGVYTGSVAVSGDNLAGFLVTDTSDDKNIIGMLDFERDVNIVSGAFVYQFKHVIKENDKNYAKYIEVK